MITPWSCLTTGRHLWLLELLLVVVGVGMLLFYAVTQIVVMLLLMVVVLDREQQQQQKGVQRASGAKQQGKDRGKVEVEG